MSDFVLPNYFTANAVKVFREGNRKGDPAAAIALDVFLAKVEEDPSSLPWATTRLKNDTAISDFIEDVRKKLAQNDAAIREEYLEEVMKFLERIETNTNKLGSEITELKKVATDLKKSSAELAKETKKITGLSTSIIEKVNIALDKLSVRSALAIGLVTGLASGLGGNYLYERYLSLDALKHKEQKVEPAQLGPQSQEKPGVALQTSSEPLPNLFTPKWPWNEARPFLFDPYGRDCETGKNLLDALNNGENVLLHFPKGVKLSISMKAPSHSVQKPSHALRVRRKAQPHRNVP
jgi:AraC-like DNA-binding protein